jgi:hypothetical protein
MECGKAVRLAFLNQSPEPLSVAFPFEQAVSITMTLPQVLSISLKLRTRSEKAGMYFR